MLGKFECVGTNQTLPRKNIDWTVLLGRLYGTHMRHAREVLGSPFVLAKKSETTSRAAQREAWWSRACLLNTEFHQQFKKLSNSVCPDTAKSIRHTFEQKKKLTILCV